LSKKFSSAASPPAEAPIPTTYLGPAGAAATVESGKASVTSGAIDGSNFPTPAVVFFAESAAAKDGPAFGQEIGRFGGPARYVVEATVTPR
jgi:hypothetical protein